MEEEDQQPRQQQQQQQQQQEEELLAMEVEEHNGEEKKQEKHDSDHLYEGAHDDSTVGERWALTMFARQEESKSLSQLNGWLRRQYG